MISHHRHHHGHHESSPIDYNTTTTTTTTTTTSTTSLRSSKLGTGDTHVTSHPTRLCHGGPNRHVLAHHDLPLSSPIVVIDARAAGRSESRQVASRRADSRPKGGLCDCLAPTWCEMR
ncbi:hypothetical protein G5I_13664 [Acromyrmex echinatior]|uniref:Uncharacterized protein n=1 Tax=Acromyrmex echinatior TaxID=103372 RepID=F4X5M6_ACREC|nr:hypothetical protein G5I_13664 [Acromyrmex echinatior]